MTTTILQRKKDKILGIHGELSYAKDLKPSKRNNILFSELVEIVQDTSSKHSNYILNSKEIKSIRNDLLRISSKAEYELELFWVKFILKSVNTKKTLSNFPYYINYEKMTELEIGSLQLCNYHKRHKVLFVGSGPLPLSSIMMADTYGMLVDNLDMDYEACALSKKLIEKINLSDKISTIKGNVLDIQNFSEYQTIFIAALAGDSEDNKTKIINHIVAKCEKSTHIVLRSVSDLGTLLYPKITSTQIKDIEVICRSKSPRDIINNVIIGKKK